MHDQGMISDAQYDDAKAKFLWPDGFGDPGGPTTPFYPPPENGAAQYPYFVDYVRQLPDRQVRRRVRRGLRLHERAARSRRRSTPASSSWPSQVVNNAVGKAEPTVAMSLVSVDPSNGFVKAMVGGRDFAASQVNLALGGSYGLLPGSSMKPYTMATALEQGITPDTVYPRHHAPGRCPALHQVEDQHAASSKVRPPSTMAPAIAESSNTYFAQLAYDVGPEQHRQDGQPPRRQHASTPTRRTTTSRSPWAPRRSRRSTRPSATPPSRTTACATTRRRW